MTQPLSIVGLKLFFTLLLTKTCLPHRRRRSSPGPVKLFTNHHGRSHRLTGLFHLLLLLFGTFSIDDNYGHDRHYNHNNHHHIKYLIYDCILGISGIITTLTASSSFPHKRVLNQIGESGTLSRYAIVTQSEMLEHVFYQGMNLWQALYLHLITSTSGRRGGGLAWRFLLLFVVTIPWAIRKHFPVNSFSSNWRRRNGSIGNNSNNNDERNVDCGTTVIQVGTTENGSKSLWLINGMYRFKKAQYVFYKHVILRGLNVSVASSLSLQQEHEEQEQPKKDDVQLPLPLTSQWRIFWLLLNTSYVMEFFLQSLVKRGVLTQRFMMVLNALLMISSTIAAMEVNVLGQVRIEAALLSLLFNFSNRGHDILNTMVTFLVVHFIRIKMYEI